MKKNFAVLTAVLSMILLGVASCSIQDPPAAAQSGSMSISIPHLAPWLEPYSSASESSLPQSRAFLYATSVDISLRSGASVVWGPQNFEISGDLASSSDPSPVTINDIPVGSYTLEVSVYNSAQGVDPVLQGSKSDVVISYGDTTSAMVTVFPVEYTSIDLSSAGAVDPVNQDISLALEGEGWFLLQTQAQLKYDITFDAAGLAQRVFLFAADGLYMSQNLADGGSISLDGGTDYYLGVAGIESGASQLSVVPRFEGNRFYAGTSGNLRLPVGDTPRDVYLVFSHIGSSESSGVPGFTSNGSYSGPQQSVLGYQPGPAQRSELGASLADLPGAALRGTPAISEWNSRAAESVGVEGSTAPVQRSIQPGERQNLTVGTSTKNYYTGLNIADGFVPTTLRAQRLGVSTDFGAKSLYIWVANDSWHDGGTKANLLTQSMVDGLADAFLKTGSGNDIYDWVTDIFGEEWGALPYIDTIGESNEINIVLFDIDGDNSTTGGVVGYFWGKDNIKNEYVEASNEMVAFALDSVLTATPEGGTWEPEDYWYGQVISTLAHEFQHMINFYQRGILDEESDPTWINELLSMITEDLLADKIAADGPRGVSYSDYTAGSPGLLNGRLPRFNFYNDDPLTVWPGSGATMEEILRAYSRSYAMGAYLIRNYGGAQFAREYYNTANSTTNQLASILSAIQRATGESLSAAELMSRWGAAVLLSDMESAGSGISLNAPAAFTSSSGGTTYDIGAINHFNYSLAVGEGSYLDGPRIYQGADVTDYPSLYRYSNTLYLAESGATGMLDYSFTLPADTYVTVVLK